MYSTPKQFEIPISCPSCDGKMESREWDASLNILKKRSWIGCTECSYEISAEEFKKGLLTV